MSPCCYSPPCPGLVPDKEDKRARNREYTDGIFSLSLTHSRELPKHVSKHTDLFLVLSLVCSCCCCCVQPFTWAILRSLLRHEPTHREMNEASLLALLILPGGRTRASIGVRSQLDDDDVKICIGVQRCAIAERRTQARHQTIA